MSENEETPRAQRRRGPLAGITAFRVEVQVEQVVVETIRWADRLRDPDPSPVAALSGKLDDFDDNPEAGPEKTVFALRILDEDAALVAQIRRQVENVLSGNDFAITAAAPHTLRVHARTIHEAGRSHRVGQARFEVLQAVRLSPDAPFEVPVVTWSIEHVNWDEAAGPCWPALYVGVLLTLFLDEF